MGIKLQIVKPSKATATRALEGAMARYGITADEMGERRKELEAKAEDLHRDYERLAADGRRLTIVSRAKLTYVVMDGEREIAVFENEENARVFRDAIKGERDGEGETSSTKRWSLARLFGWGTVK